MKYPIKSWLIVLILAVQISEIEAAEVKNSSVSLQLAPVSIFGSQGTEVRLREEIGPGIDFSVGVRHGGKINGVQSEISFFQHDSRFDFSFDFHNLDLQVHLSSKESLIVSLGIFLGYWDGTGRLTSYYSKDYDHKFITLGPRLSFGNYWKFKKYSFGVDWLGLGWNAFTNSNVDESNSDFYDRLARKKIDELTESSSSNLIPIIFNIQVGVTL